MAINAVWNKRIGPGGRTRRVHQVGTMYLFGGPESGSTNVIKIHAFASDDSGFIGSIFINANDNVSFVAANDNNVAAVALAA